MSVSLLLVIKCIVGSYISTAMCPKEQNSLDMLSSLTLFPRSIFREVTLLGPYYILEGG